MKHFIQIIVLAVTLPAFSQQPIKYNDWLSVVPEMPNSNSITMAVPTETGTPVDPIIIRQFIFPLYQDAKETKTPPNYYFTGKITSGYDYDIVLMYHQQKLSDVTSYKQLYLITFSKEGKQLHFERVASDNIHDTVILDISTSSLINGNIILKEGNRTVNDQHFNFKSEYSITQHGIVVVNKKLGDYTKLVKEK